MYTKACAFVDLDGCPALTRVGGATTQDFQALPGSMYQIAGEANDGLDNGTVRAVHTYEGRVPKLAQNRKYNRQDRPLKSATTADGGAPQALETPPKATPVSAPGTTLEQKKPTRPTTMPEPKHDPPKANGLQDLADRVAREAEVDRVLAANAAKAKVGKTEIGTIAVVGLLVVGLVVLELGMRK